MNFELNDILAIIVVFQLLFLFVFLVTYPKGKKLSNLLLAFFFLSVCLNFTDGILIIRNFYLNYPSFAFIGNNFSLLFGPLLYLYTKSIVYRDFRLRLGMILHTAPFLVLLVFSTTSYHTQTTEVKRFILSAAGKQEMPLALYIIGGLIYLQFFSYSFAALNLVKKYRATISNHFSEIYKMNLDWLSSTITLFMIVIGVGALNSIITLTPLLKYFSLTLTLIIITIFLFINRVLFKALRQPQIFEGISEEQPENSIEIIEKTDRSIPYVVPNVVPKYVGSTLSDTEKEQIKLQLLTYMQKEKPYFEPQLTIEELADMLNLKTKILSQVINESIGQNFFDFINRYRIEEAKRLLIDSADKKITVLEVLYEVGFNSKSSFNTLFKKYTGLTPSEFKKSNTHSTM